MCDPQRHEGLLALYDEASHDLRTFMEGVSRYIGRHPKLTPPARQVVHSYKSRLKDREHLREKIERKIAIGRAIDADNFFSELTDLAGVRILHLYQGDFGEIDGVIRRKISEGDCVFDEKPKAYTWDPEVAQYFGQFELAVAEKESSYTSVHYLVRPRKDSKICCEIQVRTLFEEIWGEIDRHINYPRPTDNIACREQIKVLSKIVGAGSRLLDALQRVQEASG